jgi:nitrilase
MSRVAALQMVSGDDVAENLRVAADLIARAAADGAELAVLPENFAFLGRRERDKLAVAETDGDGPIQDFLREIAVREGLWVVAGTLPLRGDDPDRVRAASLVFDDRGRRRARYDKIHLFDVEVSDSEAYRESASLEPGSQPVVVDTPVGRLGLAVCYDLRFPELFRRLTDAGAVGFVLPSAFTAATGAAHWHTLLRARAIENLAFMIGAGQGGEHPGGRATYGHSCVVDGWGAVVAECVEPGVGVAVASIDGEGLAGRRRRFPVLEHRRELPAAQLQGQED